jgi:hypothetical protein
MSTVKFMPNEAGALITASKKNPSFGWIRVASEETILDAVTGFPKTAKKSFLIKGQIENLTSFLALYPNGVMPGKLINIEFLESQAPAEFKKLINDKIPYEEAIASYIKRPDAFGPEMTLEGERILKYTKYSPKLDVYDELIAHDNTEEIKAYVKSKAPANGNGANLG